MINDLQTKTTDSIPLVVDLDGTLIHTDLLYEGFIMLIKQNPLHIFSCLAWSLKGKAYLKNKIFSKVRLRTELLPYNAPLLKFLQSESDNGRKIILATASLKTSAEEITKLFPIFNDVYGTEGKVNLKGAKKRQLLVEHFGKAKFDYIGNGSADLEIFGSSRYSYLVNPSKSLERKTRKISELKHTWKDNKGSIGSYFKALRPYQWVKNLLLFVPLITSHTFHSPHMLVHGLLAFFSFSLVASAGYLINDLFDLNSDRIHPKKRYRPLASGKLSILSACAMIPALLAIGAYLGYRINMQFLGIVLLYFITSVSYSLYLKKFALYDVFLLATLYAGRVFAGGVAIYISLSFWLIGFSTFIFLSLAFIKRYSELARNGSEAGLLSRGRQYFSEDIHLLQTMGIVSGFMAGLIFSLYIESPEVVKLYSQPHYLWGISFLFLFWICRMWLYAVRGKMTDDPIIFAIKDKISYLIFALIGVLMFVAI